MKDKATSGIVGFEQFNSSSLEKVFRMVEVLAFVFRHQMLKDYLVLKGGTALNLIHYPLKRLSVDIDLDFHSSLDKTDIIVIRQSIRDEIDQYLIARGYQKNSRSRFSYGLDALIYQYTNEKGNKDYIKIEINYLHRVHVLSPIWEQIIPNQLWPELKIKTLQPIELFATKIVALMNRLSARDFYDVYQILVKKSFSVEELSDLKSTVLFYISITSKNYERSLSPEAIHHLTYRQMKLTLLPMLSKDDEFNLEEAKKMVYPFIRDLLELSKEEQGYFQSIRNQRFQPEMLFKSSEIQNHLSNHPMIHWIMKNRPVG
jgi:predicted nucleotidyltransferase component of viral defense system